MRKERDKVLKEYVRLNEALSSAEDDALVIRRKVDHMIDREDSYRVEERVAEELSGLGAVQAPSGVEFDFSEAFFPELGGGPLTFWAGSFAGEEPEGWQPFVETVTADASVGNNSQ